MKGTYTGLGIVFGFGLGMTVGLIWFEQWWLVAAIGAALGLVVGAVAESVLRGGGSGRGA